MQGGGKGIGTRFRGLIRGPITAAVAAVRAR